LWIQHGRSSGPSGEPSGGAPPDVFLDIGANIGACSLEMLQRTDASVLAVEPSPSNLFYLTSSLQLAARAQPSLAHRVTVLPFALSNHSGREAITHSAVNLGDARIGAYATAGTTVPSFEGRGNIPGVSHDHPLFHAPVTPSLGIDVTPLDVALDGAIGLGLHGRRSGRPRVRLMKLDAQGHECHVLRGMRRLLQQGLVQLVKTEVSSRLLEAQGCSETELLALLRASWRTVHVEDARENCRGGCHRQRLATSKRQYEVQAWNPKTRTS